jgi:hypothetical protein
MEPGFTLNVPLLPLVAKIANERHRVRLVPAATFRGPAQAIGCPDRSLPHHDGVFRDSHVESIAGLDPETSAHLTRNDDLVLGADLHT